MFYVSVMCMGQNSVVDTVTLQAGQSDDRTTTRVRFSAPVQSGPGAKPASCTIGTGSFFPRGKVAGYGIDHPLAFLVQRLKKEQKYYSFS